MPADDGRTWTERFVPPLALLAVVGGFGLSFTGTLGRGTLVGWLGYPEYDWVAFAVGWAGLVVAVAYGYYASERS